jgi:DNA polymerase-3 subunit delta'
VLTFELNPRTGKMRQELVVDQVRRLSSSLCLTNTVSRRKAALLFPAEAMNKSTANALLKTLEEPPGEAVLILVSDAPARLPATIRSRCQRLEVRLPGRKAAVDWLRSEHGVNAERANTALEAAAGSPLRALKLMEDGGLDAYALLHETLDRLGDGAITPPAAMTALESVDPTVLWGWLSLRAARETRSAVSRGMDARDAAGLQREADRNRQWTGTPLRKDLLLQDWLIQWAALTR